MIYYAEATEQCRSKMLLAYFEDYRSGDCGICDYCLKRNREGINIEEFEIIKSKLVRFLKDRPSSAKELIAGLGFSNENKVLSVIQTMLDNDELHYSENNILNLTH